MTYPGPVTRPLRLVLAWVCLQCGVSWLAGAEAPRTPFSIPGGDAALTLRQLSRQAPESILFPIDLVHGIQTQPVQGNFTAREAAERMTAGSELFVSQDPQTGALLIGRVGRPETDSTQSPPSPAASPFPMKPRTSLSTFRAWLGFALGVGHAHAADPAAAGALEGRVFSTVNGDYINNARVAIDGTQLETRSNSFGEYRFEAVPAGAAVVRVLVSGYAPRAATATVTVGATATLNFDLTMDRGTVASDGTVLLDSFVVAAQREMSGSAVAINERRAAANLKNVIAADEFGDSAEGNIGEFVKYLPGIALDYTSAEPRFITVRGMPSFGTAVMIDGSRLASAAGGFSRATEFDQVSLNNISRIEVSKSPTPDTPADTIGGSINMVLKSAFERAKPVFNYRVNLNANHNDAYETNFASFKATPAPTRGTSRKIMPGFDFTYINPMSRNFGFSVSVMNSNQFTPEGVLQSQWLPSSGSSSVASADNPFLNQFIMQDSPREIHRWSIGATLDWRLGANDVISASGQWNRFDTTVVNANITFSALNVRPTSFGRDYTESAARQSEVLQSATYHHKIGRGYNLRLSHRHTGPLWQFENGGAYSYSESEFVTDADGAMTNVRAHLRNFTLRFDGIENSLPGTIALFDDNRVPVNYRGLDNYTLSTMTLNPSMQRSATSSAFANATRIFSTRIPFRIKAGVDVRREEREFRGPTSTYSFVGPDKIAMNFDDSVGRYDLVYSGYNQINRPFGYGHFERLSNHKIYELLQAHPNYFVKDEVAFISSTATGSRKLTETVASGYLRSDLSLFNNRLKLVGGVRYEKTFDEGYGMLNDIAATYQRNAAGEIVRGANGRPLSLPGDAVTLARLRYQERGAHAKRRYGSYYPSLNASAQISEKLLVRASYARTITRPELSNIVPSTTATDPTLVTTNPTITVSNTALRPWTSDSYDLACRAFCQPAKPHERGVAR